MYIVHCTVFNNVHCASYNVHCTMSQNMHGFTLLGYAKPFENLYCTNKNFGGQFFKLQVVALNRLKKTVDSTNIGNSNTHKLQ